MRAGLGIAMLPCLVGDLEPDLVRCFPPVPELEREVWLILREDARLAPHIRAFADHLAAHLSDMRALITGRMIEAGAGPR